MEAILSAKEPSEKVRNAAFALLVTMGRKMKDGGVVDMSLLDGAIATPGDIGAREANVQEFVGMVGASLAAEKDHTISAGVMALSRVLFEFRSTLNHMLSTKVEANHRLMQVIFPQSTSRRFSTLSTPFSLQGIVKSLRPSLVSSSSVCIVSPPRSSSPNSGI
jgi:hypothetical protein